MNGAATFAGLAMAAPFAFRFVQFGDVKKLAAQRTFAARTFVG